MVEKGFRKDVGSITIEVKRMKKDEERFETDVLVLGSGLSGCMVALIAAKKGLHVTVITRSEEPEESSTKYAQGGIIAEVENDSPELLEEDILRAGDGLCNPEAVKILANEGPRLVEELLIKELGIEFTKEPKGSFHMTREAAHSCKRILHVDDATGRAIESKLIEHLQKEPNIEIITNHSGVDLVTNTHHSKNPLAIYDEVTSMGTYVLDRKTKKIRTVLSKKTVLATGGIGQIYLHTTNPEGARGDGVAMAYRAGASIINAEFIQFHPTTFYKKDAERFLISEAVRGEGAKLMNMKGDFFMKNYDEKLKDLAPRDVVARSIHEEMVKDKDDYVLLDMSFLKKNNINIKKRFPNIYEQCLRFGIDITKEPIPVVPSAHYFCGGVRVDSWGRTNLKDLYAVGEVSCTGLHGANRLASTSLLECLVWGYRAGKDIIKTIDKKKSKDFSSIPLWDYTGLEEEIDPALIYQDWLNIKTTMWNYAGIVRTSKRLERAKADMDYLCHRIEQFYRRTLLTDSLVGLRNGILVALIVINSALRNKRSMGCHYRKD
ncbi:MAG TPA: L-aspartate oxidase [Nitrospinota bacterium]|nr:L-aspartate oxidase [Nitrospinota bacterium]